MNTNPIFPGAFSFDMPELGSSILVAVVVVAVAAMIFNAVLTARRVKKADQAVHDRLEKTLHPNEKKAPEPAEKAAPAPEQKEKTDK